jgi:uncharacterized protein (TIGR02284 family)
MEAKQKEKNSVKVLNDLVIINNERIKGYETAAKETDDIELKDLFNSMATESQKYKSELINTIIGLDGEPKEGTSASSKIYQVWMDLKSALTKGNKKVILSSCEFGEDAALQAYKEALESDDLSSTSRSIITNQKNSLQNSHNRIKLMRDRA